MKIEFVCLFFTLSSYVHSARILGFFFVPSISHQKVFQPIWRELSLRGHEVTVITTNPLRDLSLTNLTEIDIEEVAYSAFAKFPIQTYSSEMMNPLLVAYSVMNVMENTIVAELRTTEFQEVLKLPSDHFDLVLIEPHHPLVYGLPAKFKSPFIAISSFGGMLHTHDSIGNIIHPVLYPDVFMTYGGKLSFWNRWESVLFTLTLRLMHKYMTFPRTNILTKKYFGEDITPVEDVMRNTSLILLNINPLFSRNKPILPAVVPIFGLHLRPKNDLPKHLQKVLDEAKNGVVYFSLGTNVRIGEISENQRTVIIDALKELPYTILLKWQDEMIPNQPKNMILSKWFPQQDILGHPNVKVFVTQGGLQSIDEAIANEVPIVGIPYFADQPMNIKKMVEHGTGIHLDAEKYTKQDLQNAIIDVMKNPKYRDQIRTVKSIVYDQPMSGLDKAVWWCEYVIRHKGARHLRSPALDIPWYQYYLLDVALATLASAGLIIYAIFFLIRTIIRNIGGSSKVKTT